jgi:hypothetical protein
MPATETKAAPRFRKTAESFEPRGKSLPQRYFISPEVFGQEPSFAKATARQAGYE